MNPWDQRYNTETYYYGTEPNDFLKQNITCLPPQGRVLCLAEGEGRNAVFLASLGHQITAVDGSQVGLEKLQKLAQIHSVKVKTILADLNDYVIQAEEWDAIISIWCHIPPELRKKVHKQVMAGLKPKGIFLLEAYHPHQLEYKTGGPPTTELMMTVSDLANELDGLDFKILHEIDRDVHEGQGHHGKSAVVQILGYK